MGNSQLKLMFKDQIFLFENKKVKTMMCTHDTSIQHGARGSSQGN